MLTQPLLVLLVPQECLPLLPRHDEVLRLHVIGKAGVRLDPLGAPLVSPDVFDDPYVLERCVGLTNLAKRVLLPGPDVRLLH